MAQIAETQNLCAFYVCRKWSYLWAEGGKQPELETSLGVGGFGYPAFVALKPTDNKFSTMRR
jgi:protein disulfide-isomerase A6